MFGKKTNEEKPIIPISARIETIPQAFYGGSDPLVYQSSPNTNKTVVPEMQILPTTVPPPPLQQPKAANGRVLAPRTDTLQKPLPQNGKKKVLIIVGIALFALSVILYFGYSYFFVADPVLEPVPVVVIPPPAPVEVIPIITVTTTPEPVVTSTPTLVIRGGGTLTLPEFSYVQVLDDDKDTVSDREEAEVFETDPGVWDSDKDGYYDGLEIGNLYNPKGIAPQRIIDSGLVKEYVSPLWQYRLYYPSMWKMDSIDARGDDILLSGSSGDYIEIRSFKKEQGTSFVTWFSELLPTESFGTFIPFENRFKMNGYKRQDGRVAFYNTDTAVYSIVYFYGTEERNSYPKVMEVLVQSFRPSKVNLLIPEQRVLPGVVLPESVSSSMVAPPDFAVSSTPFITPTSTFTSLSNSSTTSTPTLVPVVNEI